MSPPVSSVTLLESPPFRSIYFDEFPKTKTIYPPVIHNSYGSGPFIDDLLLKNDDFAF